MELLDHGLPCLVYFGLRLGINIIAYNSAFRLFWERVHSFTGAVVYWYKVSRRSSRRLVGAIVCRAALLFVAICIPVGLSSGLSP